MSSQENGGHVNPAEDDWKAEAAAAGAEVDASLDSGAESGVDAGAAEDGYAHYVPADEIRAEGTPLRGFAFVEKPEGSDEDEEDGEEGGAGFVSMPNDLKSLRKRIDQKNKSMVRLLNRRASYALKIAEVKQAEGLAIRDDAREAEVLERVSRYNKGPLSDAALHRIFMCIMEEHRKLEGEHQDASREAES
jgi:chorismate mutase